MSTSTIEFHLDKLEDDLYRQREELLEQNNAVETTTTTTTTIPTTTLPKGYEQQHFVLSEFGRCQTKERLNTHESGQSQSDPERRTLRAPISLKAWQEELEKKASARHHQSSKKSSTKNTNVLLRAGSASARKTSMSGKAAGPRTKAKTKSQAPLMKTKTSAWWRWVGRRFGESARTMWRECCRRRIGETTRP